MRKYGFDNLSGTTFDYGIHFLEFPVFEYGQEIVESVEVAGRTGTITRRTGTYSDTIITNTLEFDCNGVAEYEYKMSGIRKWLMGTKRVVYSDMEDRYFLVKKVEIEEEARRYGIFGNITVVFTCHPAVFLTEGDDLLPVSSGQILYNQYSVACPVYEISGEGVCVLNVNGKSVTANVGQNLIIDTELMIAYRKDRTIESIRVTGAYEDLYLTEGENLLTFTKGFSVSVLPKWRILN